MYSCFGVNPLKMKSTVNPPITSWIFFQFSAVVWKWKEENQTQNVIVSKFKPLHSGERLSNIHRVLEISEISLFKTHSRKADFGIISNISPHPAVPRSPESPNCPARSFFRGSLQIPSTKWPSKSTCSFSIVLVLTWIVSVREPLLANRSSTVLLVRVSY